MQGQHPPRRTTEIAEAHLPVEVDGVVLALATGFASE